MIEQLDKLPGESEAQVNIGVLRDMIYERHGLLESVSLLNASTIEFLDPVIAALPCEMGFSGPEIVPAPEGRFPDAENGEELVWGELVCSCLRCRLICFKAAVAMIASDWNLGLLESNYIMGSYRAKKKEAKA
jgi:hypothetical protein